MFIVSLSLSLLAFSANANGDSVTDELAGPEYQLTAPVLAPAPAPAPAQAIKRQAIYEQPTSYSSPDYYEPPAYLFQYAVTDEDHGSRFSVEETRDRNQASGSYSVHLPDGRIQTVTYTVAGDSGYEAVVTYEGEARFPDPEPASQTTYSSPDGPVQYKKTFFYQRH